MYVNSVVEASVPTILLFCVVRKDVDYLYKWKTFRPKGHHQSQISHAANNITITHDIYRVFIDIIKSSCSIMNYGQILEEEEYEEEEERNIFRPPSKWMPPKGRDAVLDTYVKGIRWEPL